MEKIVIGAIAKVDAGKTTLCESLLYRNKVIRKKGRVDHKDAYLDFNKVEKEKGITIFNKEARFTYKEKEYIYVDTPGHNDLKQERQRSLKILDYAILILSAIDGFDDSIYQELRDKHIKTFIFLNKIDIAHEDIDTLINKLKNKLNPNIVSISELNELIEEGLILDLQNDLSNHEIVPLIYGSALKDINIDILLDALDKYTMPKQTSDVLNAYIYKYDEKGYAHIKILSGTLLNKTTFDLKNKINEIYSINGNNYSLIQEATQNDIVAVSGLKYKVGTYLPSLFNDEETTISNNRMIVSKLNAYTLFNKIKSLNDLMPELNILLEKDLVTININSSLKEELVTKLIKDKFNIDINFDLIPIIQEEIDEEIIEEEVDDSPFVYKREEISEEELKRVFNNTYKPKVRTIAKKKEEANKEQVIVYKDIIYLIDGYNLLHTLKEYKEEDFSILRDKVIDMVCDFAGYINGECVLVFDAYKTEETRSRIINHDNITIVYTKNKQTADEYIERKSKELNEKYKVIVVTSDYLEQIRVFANGANRMSSREFIERYENFRQDKKIEHKPNRPLAELRKLLDDYVNK